MRIYIVRHGETNLNVKGCIQAQTNEPLNENGVDLALLTGRGMKDIHFDVVYSSPKARAFLTALLILGKNEASKNVSIRTDERLCEQYWGSWDTLGIVKWNYQVPCEDFSKWYSDSFNFQGPDDWESPRELIERAGEFLQEIIKREDYADKTIMISTHGGTMRALLHPYYGNDNDFWHGCVPPNCAVCILEASDGNVRLAANDLIFYDKSLRKEDYHNV